jgi:excisionase family DNA binding protein
MGHGYWPGPAERAVAVRHHARVEDWLSVQEAADACGMAYRTMPAKVRRGELPAEKPGKEWRVRRTDVEAFIERSRVQPGQLASALRRIPPRRQGDS